MDKLTASLEDYLEVIYNHDDLINNIRPIDISKKLNVSRASVSEALKKLATKGYISYGRYDNIVLTDNGIKMAQKISSKHRVLQLFFENILGLSSEEASINACRIEHVISENAYIKISEYIAK